MLHQAIISVIIPMRNAAGTIEATVRSVLDGGCDTINVTVVDDGSTDHSADLVRKIRDPRISVHASEGKGISEALNLALRRSDGGIIVRCDADDLLAPGRIAWQSEYLARRPELVGVGGHCIAIDARGRQIAELRTHRGDNRNVTPELLAGTVESHLGAYAWRREHVMAVNGFRAFFRFNQDHDFMFRMATRGEIRYVDRPAYMLRFLNGSHTHSNSLALRKWYDGQSRRMIRQRVETGADDLDNGIIPQVPQELLALTAARAQPASDLQTLLISDSWGQLRRGCRMAALRQGTRAILYRPIYPRVWVNLGKLGAKCLIPRGTHVGA